MTTVSRRQVGVSPGAINFCKWQSRKLGATEASVGEPTVVKENVSEAFEMRVKHLYQQLSSWYPRSNYSLQQQSRKLGLDWDRQLAGNLRNGFRDFSLKNRGFRDFCLKNRGF